MGQSAQAPRAGGQHGPVLGGGRYCRQADQQGLPPLLRRLQFRQGWLHRLRLIWGDRADWGQTSTSKGTQAGYSLGDE
ncbi:MAG: hypothetical protein BRC44_12225 [Cyanobacteria bacterium QS_4_48_99]|nr:MAG: hypothetical protein BRC44_12225 [Cyanobacteria bacterium QS_4_48_99]